MPKKYVSKTLQSPDYWWTKLVGLPKDILKTFNKKERDHAFRYEYSARIEALYGGKKQISYFLGKPWPYLPGVVRFALCHQYYKEDFAAHVYRLEMPDAPVEAMSYAFRHKLWSHPLRVRFNLKATPTRVGEEMAEYFSDMLRAYGLPIKQDRVNVPLSFRPIEVADSILRGESVFHDERHDHKRFLETEGENIRIYRKVTKQIDWSKPIDLNAAARSVLDFRLIPSSRKFDEQEWKRLEPALKKVEKESKKAAERTS